MKHNKFIVSFLFVFLFLSFSVSTSQANNLTITDVTLEDRNPSSDTVVVEFDLSWENSWKSKINHDAIWITVRLFDPAVTPTDKKLCQLTASGLGATGTSTGISSGLEIYVPADKAGAFVRPSAFGSNSSVSAEDVQLTIDYSSCGFEDTDDVNASVFGLEMVFVPEGAFYAGDHDTSTASLDQGSSDSDPWYISSEAAISATNPASDGYRYVSAGNTGETATGSSFTLPSSFPKGYGAFYAMKYELSEGQWIEFVNSLPSAAARENRDITDSVHKNSDSVIARNAVSCSGSPLSCASSRPGRALSYVTWMDLAAFLDWAALRPMTELEFEKMARGPILSIAGEFAWGSTDITAATTISSGDETGSETVTNTSANANYNNTILTGGDTASGANYAQGPLRIGIFATSSSDRESSGSGYYGVLELSGNLNERAITIGNADGRIFEGSHGDGQLSTLSGYEGNADQSDWPGIDAIVERGVTAADGAGFKGGAWDSESAGADLRISDRNNAAYTSTSALSNSGGRGVRTYDGD